MVLAAVVILGRQGVAVETAAVKERHIAQAILANGHFTAQSEQELVARDPLVIKEVLDLKPGGIGSGRGGRFWLLLIPPVSKQKNRQPWLN